MAVIKKENSYMGLPMNIARGNPVPLDKSEIWYSLAEMETYAKESAVAYVGQIIQLVDETEKTATAYIIANEAGDLIEVGSATLGDEKSVELTEDGVLRIVGADKAEDGAQLVMGADGKVKWVKPDTSTVTGLQTAVATNTSAIEGHETRLSAAEEEIDDLQAIFASLGGIFNFVGSKTADEFANIKAEDHQPGDVYLVDGVKEYVCVEVDGVKRWEVLGDPNGVNVLEGKVSTLEGKVSTLETFKTATESDLQQIDSDIEALETKDGEIEAALALKATAADLDTQKGRIDGALESIGTINGNITTINSTLDTKASTTYVDNKVSDINSSIAKKADQTALDNVIAVMATDEELATKVNVADYNNDKTALDTRIGAVEGVADAAKSAAATNAAAIGELQTAVDGKASASAVNALTGRVGTNETNIGNLQQSVNTLTGNVTGLTENKADKSALATTDANVAANAKAIADHAVEYTALEGRVTKAEGDIAKAQSDASQGISDAAAASSAASAAQTAADDAMAKAVEVLGTAADEATANTVFGAKAAAAAADAKAVAAQGEVDALEGVVANLKTALETADADLDSRLDDIEAVIDGVQGAMHFVGISTTDPSAGSVVIDGKDDYEAIDGDVVIYKDAEGNSIEYIYSANAWVELGDVSAEAKRIGAIEAYNTDTVAPALAKIPTIEGNIASHDTAISGLLDRMTAVEGVNTTQEAAIKALQDKTAEIEKSVTDTAAAIRGEIATEVNTLNGKITAEATARNEAVTAINNSIDAINAMLTWAKFE